MMTFSLRSFLRRSGLFLLVGLFLCSIFGGGSALAVSATAQTPENESEPVAGNCLPEGDEMPAFLILDRTTYLPDEPITGIFCFGIGSYDRIPGMSYAYYSTYIRSIVWAKDLGSYYQLFASGSSTPEPPERTETEWVEQYIALDERYQTEGGPLLFDGAYLLSSRKMTHEEMVDQFRMNAWNTSSGYFYAPYPPAYRETYVKFRYCERVVIPRELFTETEGTITLTGRLQSFFANDTLRQASAYDQEVIDYIAAREDLNERFRNQNNSYVGDPRVSISYRLEETDSGTSIVFDSRTSGSFTLVSAIIYYTPLPLSPDTKKGGEES